MKRFIIPLLSLAVLPLHADKIGCEPHCQGAPIKEIVHISPDLLIQIADDLNRENIAMVDVDPEAFDVEEKPKPLKKDPLDDVEFISEAPKK